MLRTILLTGLAAVCFAATAGNADAAPKICPDIYQPVCGSLGGHQQTFPNSCDAQRAGATGIVAGACRPKICPQIYRPVCAAIGRSRQTYPNSCMAQAAGATVISNGRCPLPARPAN